MNRYRADLHIHTVLSPCGDLEMSPVKIVEAAVRKELDIIAITDHNHTGHNQLAREIGKEYNVMVVYGIEVTTSEEVHCLSFFDTDEQLSAFQHYIDMHLPYVENDPDLFGYQVIVDRNEQIVEEIHQSLYPGLRQEISEVADEVHRLEGLFVPAHADRRMNGIYHQLGFFPGDLEADAVEIFRNTDRAATYKSHPELQGYQLLKSSDAHFIEDIGRSTSSLEMKERTFRELVKALKGIEGRRVVPE